MSGNEKCQKVNYEKENEMSEFCKQCSNELFGEDLKDVAGITTAEDTANGIYANIICEVCGVVQVDHEGSCVSHYCSKAAKKGTAMLTVGMWQMVSELLDGEKLPVSMNEALAKLCDGTMVAVPLEPTDVMREEGAQQLVRWEDGCKWPDSWSPLERAAARNEAERCWRSMVLASMAPGDRPHEKEDTTRKPS